MTSGRLGDDDGGDDDTAGSGFELIFAQFDALVLVELDGSALQLLRGEVIACFPGAGHQAVDVPLLLQLLAERLVARVARALGKKDPSHVVIDEVAGQMVAFIAVPLNWYCLLAGLILFRTFDITKPFPIRRLERLPEGTGIMLDDIGAGLYALAIMQLLLHFGILK